MTRAPRFGLVAALLVGVAVAAFLIARDGDDEPPSDRAASLVPGDAFLYLHLDSADDEGQEEASALADRVPGLSRLRDGLLARAAVSGGDIDFEADVRPWLGAEAAAALVGPSPRDARSLLVLESADDVAARAFMRRVAGTEETRHLGVTVLGTDELASALVDGFVLLGPLSAVRAALDARDGAEPALGSGADYVDLRDSLPSDRLAHAYASEEGIAALLAGPVALLGGLPGASGLEAATVSVSVAGDRAHAAFRGLSPPAAPDEACAEQAELAPPVEAPAESLAYLSLANGACFVRGALASEDSSLGDAIRALGSDLRDQEEAVDLDRDALPLLNGATTLTLSREGEEPPAATLVAHGASGPEALPVLERLQPALLSLAGTAAVAPSGAEPGGRAPDPGEGVPDPERAGRAPGFEAQDLGGVTAFTAALAPGIQLSYASFDDTIAVSTALAGVEQAAAPEGEGLAATEEFSLLLEDRPPEATAVVFLDLDRLFALGDQVGLAEDPSYATAREDARELGAAAAVFSREGDQTRAELLLTTQ
jgi:hypothetical protein